MSSAVDANENSAPESEATKCFICLQPMDKPSFLYGCSARNVRHIACQQCLHQWLSVTPSCPQCRAPAALILEERLAPATHTHEQLPWHLAKQYRIPQKLLDEAGNASENEENKRLEMIEELQFQLSVANDVSFRPQQHNNATSSTSQAPSTASLLEEDDEYDEDEDEDFSSGCTESSDEDDESFSLTEDDDEEAIAFSLRKEDARNKRIFSESNYNKYYKKYKRDDSKSYTVDEDEDEDEDEISSSAGGGGGGGGGTRRSRKRQRTRNSKRARNEDTIEDTDNHSESSIQVRSVESASSKTTRPWRSSKRRKRK